jgi:DNA-directed RNA polymerase specialized sigma24 family protein
VNPSAVLDVCYVRHYPRSLKFARSHAADYQLAEDLIQEAAWRIARLPEDKDIEKPWSYWCQTIVRLTAEHFRHQLSRRNHFTEVPLEILWHADAVTDAGVIAARDELACVMQAMEKLTPPELRELKAHLVDCPDAKAIRHRRHNTDSSSHRVALSRARRHLVEIMA